MMRGLERRGHALGRELQMRRVRQTAARLRELLRGARVDEDDARIIVSGRGLVRRWLGDPQLRFVGRTDQ